MSRYLVYITAPNRDEALQLGRMLVEKRLAACANVLDKMHSVYWWKGKIDEADEAVLIVKTRQEKLEPLTAAVKTAHSYDCPCIVSLPIEQGNPDFLNWIDTETEG